MNPTHITFPTTPRELRLKRSPAIDSGNFVKMQEALAKGQIALQTDNEALRLREENLQAYEQQLRELQNLVQSVKSGASLSTAPTPKKSSGDESALALGWNKLHRSRELLEVEQRQLSDDQHVLLQARDVLRQKEIALAAREQAVALAEAQLKLAEPQLTKPSRGLFGLTRVPFKLPNSVFNKS